MSEAPALRRRRVHYFSGFDPRGPAFYHRLCRDEAAKPQPQGGHFSVGRRERLSPLNSRWRVQWHAQPDGHPAVDTEHVFMGWDDIIRRHWSRRPGALLREFFGTYAGIAQGVGPMRARALSRTAFLTGILPAVYLLGTLALGALAGALLALLIGPLAWALGAALVAGLWAFGAKQGLFWLLRIFTFIIRSGRAPLPEMQARAREWADTVIAMQQADPVDEVLLVGHSVGTLVMVDAVDLLLADPRWQALPASQPTRMVTLGQCIPFVALVPSATHLREALHRLSHHPRLMWWDVTARIDPLCFYNVHPLAGSGVPHRGAPQPLRHNAKFFQMYEPARWAHIRRDKLTTHFLYLMTPDKPGNFQPLDVLYGPRTLAEQVQRKGEP
ncbi:hypothetical protein [Hydrogenophaga sp.]|jgi:hypothetical protein|uniref:hypothetical protein n=1 Tax=Hydrogenophaga sp. TaxID=1904254 RepID=UPI003918C2DC